MRTTLLLFILVPFFTHATQWQDPDFDKAIRAAGLICTGVVESSSPKRTSIRLLNVFKGLQRKGMAVTIYRSAIIGVGHEDDQLPVGDTLFFIVKSYGKDYIAFTDTYWCFSVNDSFISLPIRDPSAFVTVKRTSFETFLYLLLHPSSTEKKQAFLTEQLNAIAGIPLLTKSAEAIFQQIFALEVLSYFGQPQQADAITRFLNSPYYQVRWSCVRALITCGGSKSKAAIMAQLSREEHENVQSVLGKAVFILRIAEAKAQLEKQIPLLTADEAGLTNDIMSPLSNSLPPARNSYAAALMRINGVKGTYEELVIKAKDYIARYPGIQLNILENKETYTSMEEALKNPDAVYILVLDRKGLTEVPPEIRRFKNLKSLSLFRNKIKQLPDFLPELGLISLDINDNGFGQVPEVIYRCTTLEELDMGSNGIQHVSADISKLKNLKKLKLRMNKLEALPTELSQLNYLEEIELYGNDFYRFPTVLTGCTALKIIHLGSNDIKQLPVEIAGMPKLKYVDLSYNQLPLKERSRTDQLPASISINTESYSDRHYSIYEAIADSTHAKIIHDSHNDYSNLQADFSVLVSAEYLVFTFNQLSRFPRNVTSLTHLKSLVLHHNNIKEVPEDICRMKSLSYLDLSYNQLTKLPAALKELPLTRLDLSNNAFSEEERKTIESWFKGKCKIVW